MYRTHIAFVIQEKLKKFESSMTTRISDLPGSWIKWRLSTWEQTRRKLSHVSSGLIKTEGMEPFPENYFLLTEPV